MHTIDKALVEAIDTVLVKLLAESQDTEALHSLIESSEDIVVDEIEETLIDTRQYNALVKICRKRSDEGKLLEIWSKCVTSLRCFREGLTKDVLLSRLVDGEWTENDIQDPLGQMMALLSQSRDRGLVQRWGLWLIKRDPAAGLKVRSMREILTAT